jgi:hypothetical protein
MRGAATLILAEPCKIDDRDSQDSYVHFGLKFRALGEPACKVGRWALCTEDQTMEYLQHNGSGHSAVPEGKK